MDQVNNNFGQKYSLLEHIADGRFATVHKCLSIDNGDCYAAKMIKKKRAPTSKRGASVESISMEIDVLRELRHPNIIQIYDSFDTRDKAILILELVSGGELFEYISDKGTLSEDEASKFVHQILLGVNHIHSNEILHLDLKPENILVENAETQKIKIIDFGLARKLSKEKAVLGIQGTAAFLAPELVNYEELSFATDMWSIGVITFTMLNGFNPFVDTDENITLNNILRCLVDFDDERCSKISDLAKDFIYSLLTRKPKDRLLSDACLDHSWIISEIENVAKKRLSFVPFQKLQSLKSFVVSPKRPVSEFVNDEFWNNSSNRLSLPVSSQLQMNGNDSNNNTNESSSSTAKTSMDFSVSDSFPVY